MKKNRVMTRRVHALAVLPLLAIVALGGERMFESRGQIGSENEEVKQLLTVLRDEQMRNSEPSRVVAAIKRLGEMKATTAIDDLIQLLTFKHVYEWEMSGVDLRTTSIFRRYPATHALFQIGKPSLPALVKVIGTDERGSLASENARNTLMEIFRWNPLEGVEYLRKASLNAPTLGSGMLLSEAAEKSAEMIKKLEKRQ